VQAKAHALGMVNCQTARKRIQGGIMDVFKGVIKLFRRERAQHVREIAKLDAVLKSLGSKTGPRRELSAAARAQISAA
jgi:hypothetical protein